MVEQVLESRLLRLLNPLSHVCWSLEDGLGRLLLGGLRRVVLRYDEALAGLECLELDFVVEYGVDRLLRHALLLQLLQELSLQRLDARLIVLDADRLAQGRCRRLISPDLLKVVRLSEPLLRRGLGIGSEIQYRVLISDQRLDLRRASPGIVGVSDVAPRILLDLLVVSLAEQMRKIPLLLGAATLELDRHGVLALLALEEQRELLSLVLKFLDAGLAEAKVAVARVHKAGVAHCAGLF